MSISGATFSGVRVTPSDDGAVFAACVADGLYGNAITLSGTAVRITRGKIVACGRVIRVTSNEDFTLNQNEGDYARLLLTIDMSKSGDQRWSIDLQYANSENGFSAPTQNDINNGGTKYQMPICMVDLRGSSPVIIWRCGPAHGKGHGVSVTLPRNGWSNNEQKVYVDGVTPTNNVTCTYDYASKENFQAADIDIVGQGYGWARFHAVTVPTTAVTVNLLLL